MERVREAIERMRPLDLMTAIGLHGMLLDQMVKYELYELAALQHAFLWTVHEILEELYGPDYYFTVGADLEVAIKSGLQGGAAEGGDQEG